MIGHMLTDMEMDLVLELLKAESSRLTGQTTRYDAGVPRKEIRERERVVDRLIERFREIKAGDLTE